MKKAILTFLVFLLDGLISYLAPKKHWYAVRYVYKGKDGRRLFDFQNCIGVEKQAHILNPRALKIASGLLHKVKNKLIRRYLCNGTYTAEIECYLGYFYREPKTTINENTHS